MFIAITWENMMKHITRALWTSAILMSAAEAETHLDIAVPDLMDTDLKGPVRSVDEKVTYNISGKFDRERSEFDQAGNLLSETEWNAEGVMIITTTNTYDESGEFVHQFHIDFEDAFTNDWEVYLSPETRQIAMKKTSTGAAALHTYNDAGYALSYRHYDKELHLVSGSDTKRDDDNRREEYTRLDRKGAPIYTYWFRHTEDGFIDRERQKYHKRKAERLHVYEYLKTDEFGNWTQRLMVRYDIGGKEKQKVWERLVIRDIEYYFDTAGNPIKETTPGGTTNAIEMASETFDSNPDSEASSETREKIARTEELEAEKDERSLKAAFNYTFDDISDKLVIISCKSERGRSAGSGFIAKMDGKTYLFTNQHVIMGADTIRLKTASGETITPAGSVELSHRRDIARIALNDRDAFELATTFPMGSPLGVFGNSEGAGVATELFGEVTGLGVDLVEVNAEFVSGNSGSPVLDSNQNVIGIASFVRVTWEDPKDKKEKKAKKKSKDEDEDEESEFTPKTRRFCYRMDDLKWRAVSWKRYNDKYGKLYRNSERIAQEVFDIINVWSDSVVEPIPEKDDMTTDLESWVKKHNDIIARLKRNGYSKNSFLNAYSGSLEILSKTCHDRSRRVAMFSKQRELSGFLRDEFEKNAYSLEYAGHYIQAIADNIADQ